MQTYKDANQDIHIFFGEMGGGKTFLGQRFAEQHGLEYLDGDRFMPPKMKEKVERFSSLNKKLVFELVWRLSHETMEQASKTENGLVVSYAFYRAWHRHWFNNYLVSGDFVPHWYWVRPPLIRHAKQLLGRERGKRWLLYWLRNKPFFQKPSHWHTKILHETDLPHPDRSPAWICPPHSRMFGQCVFCRD